MISPSFFFILKFIKIVTYRAILFTFGQVYTQTIDLVNYII